MSKKRSDSGNARAGRRRRNQAVSIIVALCIAGSFVLAQVNTSQKSRDASGEVSISTFSASSPSREYVYAGARLVATENDYSIFPTYQSFPGNGGTGMITVTAPSGVGWTAVSNNTNFVTITSGSSGSGNGVVYYSVAANTGSSIRSGTISVNSQTFTVYQGIDFLDVPSNYIFYEWIGRLAARGVTLGCGNGNFCPNDPVPQEQMAAFVIRALGDFNPPTPPSQRFNDVPPSNQFYAFIEQMAVRGIWTGCGGNNYCPADAVKREEMAAIMIRGRGEFNPPTPSSQRFYDVPPSNQYYNFIDRMAVLGITSGCGTACNAIGMPCYCRADPVMRGQMAVFLVRAFNL